MSAARDSRRRVAYNGDEVHQRPSMKTIPWKGMLLVTAPDARMTAPDARTTGEPTSFDAHLDAYLSLLLTLGLDLQPGQNLVVSAPASPLEEIAPVMRRVIRRAYELGARNVYPQWDDGEVARTRLALAPEEALSDVQMWRIHWFEELSAEGAAFLTLAAPNPDLFAGIDPERIATSLHANAKASTNLMTATTTMRHPWCVGAIATRVWAHKVFPELNDDAALAALWNYIFNATRINTPDPLQAWRAHLAHLTARMEYLNGMNFRSLRYSAPGTDLTIELPEGHRWVGGGGKKGVPNIPTEEVFSLPKRDGVHGTARSTMPLNYNGQLIEGIRLRLEGGRIVEFAADRGEEALRSIIETDEGSHYLGEVALVPADSPINIGRPVYNTLFDENAACHIAIGRAYPICITGGAEMAPDELLAHGVNVSNAHVDFMIGSRELAIDGETPDGALVPVFRAGMWALPAER